jgi:hypothetical protein
MSPGEPTREAAPMSSRVTYAVVAVLAAITAVLVVTHR